MTAEGTFPKSDGDILYGSEVNAFNNKLAILYTGDGFNTSGTETDSHEFNEVTTIKGDYVEVCIQGSSSCGQTGNNSGSGSVALKIEIKEIGGAYATVVNNTFNSYSFNGNGNITSGKGGSFTGVSELTAGMKTNGFQIKITCTGVKSTDGVSNFNNTQTTVKFI